MKKAIFFLLMILSVAIVKAEQPVVQEYANQDTIDNVIASVINNDIQEDKSDAIIVAEKFEKLSDRIIQITEKVTTDAFPELVAQKRISAYANIITLLFMLLLGLSMWAYQTILLKNEHKGSGWDLSDTAINYWIGLVMAGIASIILMTTLPHSISNITNPEAFVYKDLLNYLK